MPAQPEEDGTFRREVAETLLNVVAALTRLVLDQTLTAAEASAESNALATAAYAAYPFADLWQEVVDERLPTVEWLRPTLAEVMPTLTISPASTTLTPIRRAANETARGWPDVAQTLARSLQRDAAGSLTRAEALLEQQRRYAVSTGDPYYLVRSLCNFAQSLWDENPALALAWVNEAYRWDAANPVVWGSLTSATLRTEGPEAALPIGWQAVAKFPNNAGVHHELARALVRGGRFAMAAALNIYTEDRFDSEYAGVSLAEVFAEAGRPIDAARHYVNALYENRLPDRYARGLVGRVIAVPDPDERARLAAAVLYVAPERPNWQSARDALQSVAASPAPPDDLPLGIAPWIELPDSSAFPDASSAAVEVQTLSELRVLRRLRSRSVSASNIVEWINGRVEHLEESVPRTTLLDVEHILLSLSASEVEKARDLLADSRLGKDMSPAGDYVRARLIREQARGRKVTAEGLDEMRRPWIDLRRRHPDLRSASLLGEARAALAVQDGDLPYDEAQRSFGKLFKWSDIYRQTDGRFESDWAQSVVDLLDPLRETGRSGPLVLAFERSVALELDELEEDYAARLAAAA
jgi:hypothetical protein